MTNQEILSIFNGLSEPKNNIASLSGAIFSYAVIRNISKLKNALIDLGFCNES